MSKETIVKELVGMVYVVSESTSRKNGIDYPCLSVTKDERLGVVLREEVWDMPIEDVVEIIENAFANQPTMADNLDNADYIREHLSIRLMGADRTVGYPTQKSFLNGVNAVLVIQDEEQSILLNDNAFNHFSKLVGLDAEEMWSLAFANLDRTAKPKVKTMYDQLIEMMGEEFAEIMPPTKEEDAMIVVSNACGTLGANVIQLPSTWQMISKYFNGDVYVIPSSIHELIILDASKIRLEDVTEMVRNVNDTQVADEDRLSYEVTRINVADMI